MISRYTRPEMGAIWSEENRVAKWLQVEILTCESQAELGLIPKEAVEKIKAGARFDIERIKEIERVTKHDVIAFLNNLEENLGEESRYIHLGLTSSDVLDTATAIQLKEASQIISRDLDALLEALKKRAFEHKDTICVGRSHGIHAEPTVFGLKFALWYDEMKRNRRRFEAATESVCYGQISGAVGNFANIPPGVEEYVCRKAGLKPAPVSTQVIQRDRHAEYMSALALIASSIDKIAVEIRHLQRTEVLEAEEFFSKGQKGSSAMPHKRNPIVSEQMSGLARVIRGNLQAALENVPLWHERDISHSSVERIILPDSTILLDYMLNKMINLIANLLVYPEKMKANLEITGGLVFSGQILLELARAGVLRDEAYVMVQRNAMRVWKKEAPLQELISRDAEIKKHITQKQIDACFDFARYKRHLDTVYTRVFNS